MLGALSSRTSWTYKSVFDGLDFSRSKIGKEFLNEMMLRYVQRHCIMTEMFDLEDFVASCVRARREAEPEHPVPVYLRDKYEYGLFVTSPGSCFDNPYILFNREQLDFWNDDGVSTWGIPFLVCPSRGLDGRINEVGFRVLDVQRVESAFKWIFLRGGRATYGAHELQGREAVAVEGAFDQLAFAESGVKNVIGLGSVFLNDGHVEELPEVDLTFCLDQDAFGTAQRSVHRKYCFFTPEAKDPFDAWLASGAVSLVHVSQE